MNPLDELFRDGLGERAAETPAGMWERIRAGQSVPAPEGEEVDQLFADALKDADGSVPADMWGRISASGLPVPAPVDQVFRTALVERTAAVPAGMWAAIWRARTAAAPKPVLRWAAAAAALLLLLGGGWWFAAQDTQPASSPAPSTFFAPAAAPLAEAEISAATAAVPTTPTPTTAVTSITPEPSPLSRGEGLGERISATNRAQSAGANQVKKQATPGATGPTAPPTPVPPAGKDVIPAAPRLASAAVALLPVPTSDLTVKKYYLPRRDELPVTPFRAASRHRLQLEFLFGGFYANQSFAARTEDERDLREARNLNENPDLSYQATLRGSYNLNRRLHLLGGLTYAEIRNESAYTQVANGVPRDIVTTNHLRILEAPLLLGLRMPGRRMMVSLNAGPVVNLAFAPRGRFIDPAANEPLDLKVAGNYRKNIGVGLMTSLSINYQLGKQEPFLLLVEPFFKTYPTSFTVADAPLRESYWTAGVQFGIRKGF